LKGATYHNFSWYTFKSKRVSRLWRLTKAYWKPLVVFIIGVAFIFLGLFGRFDTSADLTVASIDSLETTNVDLARVSEFFVGSATQSAIPIYLLDQPSHPSLIVDDQGGQD